MKTLSKLLLLIPFFFVAGYFTSLSAQPPGWQQTLNNISMQNAQQWSQHQMQKMLAMRGIKDSSHIQSLQLITHEESLQLIASEKLKNHTHNFIVTMKDSTKLKVRSKVYSDTMLQKTCLEFINKQVDNSDSSRIRYIYPEQTSKVEAIESYGNTIGLATDSCWLFKVVSGKVNAYSYLPETGFGLTWKHLVAIQLDNGLIEPITLERVKQIFSNDKEAMRALEEKGLLEAISYYNSNHLL